MNSLMDIGSADTAPWNIAEHKSEGSVILLRYRPDLKPYIGLDSHPQRLVILWDYEPSNSSGMPTDELNESMRDFEDRIVNSLDHDRVAIFAFALTKYGVREWHFYAGDISEIGGRINSALSDLPVLPIQLQVEDDPHWSELRAVYELCNELP